MARARWRKVHKSYTLRSGFEKKVAAYLDEHQVPYKYEEETIKYTVPETKHRYVPDFMLDNGVFIEVKGNFDAKSRQKMAYVIEQNPDLDIRMLFMSDNRINKSSKTRYSDWCEKRGIDYHITTAGTIPVEWTVPNPKRKERPIKKEKKKECQKKPKQSLSSRAKSTELPSQSRRLEEVMISPSE